MSMIGSGRRACSCIGVYPPCWYLMQWLRCSRSSANGTLPAPGMTRHGRPTSGRAGGSLDLLYYVCGQEGISWLRLRNVATLRVMRARPGGTQYTIRAGDAQLDPPIQHCSPMYVASSIAGSVNWVALCPLPIKFLLLRARLIIGSSRISPAYCS